MIRSQSELRDRSVLAALALRHAGRSPPSRRQLEGTEPLTLTGDIPAQMRAGIDQVRHAGDRAIRRRAREALEARLLLARGVRQVGRAQPRAVPQR